MKTLTIHLAGMLPDGGSVAALYDALDDGVISQDRTGDRGDIEMLVDAITADLITSITNACQSAGVQVIGCSPPNRATSPVSLLLSTPLNSSAH